MSVAAIKSVQSTTRFPAVPSPQAALLLSVLHQLEASQWWTPARLAGHQRQQLRLLVAHAQHTVPWYRERIASARPGDDQFATQFAQIPILRRVDLQRHGASLRSAARGPGHQQPRPVSSSGSTGTSVTVDVTEAARL